MTGPSAAVDSSSGRSRNSRCSCFAPAPGQDRHSAVDHSRWSQGSALSDPGRHHPRLTHPQLVQSQKSNELLIRAEHRPSAQSRPDPQHPPPNGQPTPAGQALHRVFEPHTSPITEHPSRSTHLRRPSLTEPVNGHYRRCPGAWAPSPVLNTLLRYTQLPLHRRQTWQARLRHPRRGPTLATRIQMT
jgi:hypothetical protein